MSTRIRKSVTVPDPGQRTEPRTHQKIDEDLTVGSSLEIVKEMVHSGVCAVAYLR